MDPKSQIEAFLSTLDHWTLVFTALVVIDNLPLSTISLQPQKPHDYLGL